MPSPFPGMDPWLEAPGAYPNFHANFLSAVQALLNAALTPPYYAAIATRVYAADGRRYVEPDVDVFRPAAGGGTAVTTAVATDELVELGLLAEIDEEYTERFAEVRTADDSNRLVTSIELLSPSNKTLGTSGRELYRAKQRELQHAGVHLIEIDLLRAGRPTTVVDPDALRRRAGPFAYHVAVWRADRPDRTFAAPIPLTDRLPTVPVPLDPGVPDAAADLQAALARAYDEGAFARRLRYDRPPDPPLAPDQQAWADAILRGKGLKA